MKFPRYIPDGSRKLTYEDLAAEAYTYEIDYDGEKRYNVLTYSGTKSQPDFHYRYQTEDARSAAIDAWLATLRGQPR